MKKIENLLYDLEEQIRILEEDNKKLTLEIKAYKEQEVLEINLNEFVKNQYFTYKEDNELMYTLKDLVKKSLILRDFKRLYDFFEFFKDKDEDEYYEFYAHRHALPYIKNIPDRYVDKDGEISSLYYDRLLQHPIKIV